MKRLLALFALLLLLSGCSASPKEPERKQYNATFLTLFDTVTTVVARSENEDTFRQAAQKVHDDLLVYHQLFDIYNSYEGITNLKDINDAAGVAPVKVDRIIIDLLLDCRKYYELTDGRVNAAMGSVLQLWHEARHDGINDPVNASLPDDAKLRAAAEHMDFDAIVIDEAAGTVYLSDPNVQLDVGAIAKGWAAQRVAEMNPSGMLISVGGNVVATGPKEEDGTPWVVAIQNPDGGNDHLHTIYLRRGSVVTSGDYQRTYVVEGKSYHHIIDPETLYPSTLWQSVSVVCEDSALADALSTALFLLPQQQGQALLAECGAEAMWLDSAGNRFYSPGFEAMIRT